MNALSLRIMQLLALSLDLPEHHFDAACHDPMVTQPPQNLSLMPPRCRVSR
jgi:hypothetical protein